jgi:TetR/AcrR family transcriptional repressor of nem operon
MVSESAVARHGATPKGQATRQRIVAAAAALMYSNGVARTSLGEVEMAASAGRSQLYHYFPDKAHLVAAVIDYHGERISEIANPSTAALSTWAAWQQWRDDTIAHHSSNACVGGCPLGSLASELSDASEPTRQHLSESFARWEDSFRRGFTRMQEDRLLVMEADPALLGQILITALEGGILMSQTHRDPRYLEVALDAAFTHVKSFATAVGAVTQGA